MPQLLQSFRQVIQGIAKHAVPAFGNILLYRQIIKSVHKQFLIKIN